MLRKQVETATVTIDEYHFTVTELMKKFNVSRNTVRNWFITEPGVLKLAKRRIKPGNKRASPVALRIPESVALRVYRERTGRLY